MTQKKPLVSKKVLLEKYPGKGGWTYAAIPEVLPDKHAHFGWVMVKGFIDDVAIDKYHLMPMGNGRLFLPVNARIRKQIKKESGDWVMVELYADNPPPEIKEAFIACLQEDVVAYNAFNSLSDAHREDYIKWIYSAKTDVLQVERIADVINKLNRI
ncbi:MAG: DUF1905 domain-containing protein [Saprospiraceae bacterium]|nr:DUF1905 domain-containing protein [Saprospiraceae bacterium]